MAGTAEAADTRGLLAALNRGFAPNQVALFKSEDNAARLSRFAGYTDGLQVARGQAAAHLCEGAACKESVSDIEQLIERLSGSRTGKG